MAQTLQFSQLMKPIDFIIIYLACGAPFGVYFFIQQRDYLKNTKLWQKSSLLWLKCVLITLLWFPFAFTLLRKFITKKLSKNDFGKNEQVDSKNIKVDEFEKTFSQFLLESKTSVPLFEFRETFERYLGLTQENLVNNSCDIIDSNDFFQISKHENPELGTICLNRRNRFRLQQHQTLARRDFLRIIEILDSCLNDNGKLSSLAYEFANLMNDEELSVKLDKIFKNSRQTEKVLTVKTTEDEIWNPIELKQLPTKEKSFNLQTASATATMLKPD